MICFRAKPLLTIWLLDRFHPETVSSLGVYESIYWNTVAWSVSGNAGLHKKGVGRKV